MNLKEIEAIDNQLIKNVLETCWNFAEETEDRDEFGCDIHDELFNVTPYTPLSHVAESDVEELGVWICVRLVLHYEKENFGNVHPDLNPFRTANMVNYILGWHLLGKSKHLTQSDAWDRELTRKDREIIQKELRSYIEGIDDWMEFWREVLKVYDI